MAPVEQVNYVSETDLLMAIRYALYDEVVSSGPVISGDALRSLRNFTAVLTKVRLFVEQGTL